MVEAVSRGGENLFRSSRTIERERLRGARGDLIRRNENARVTSLNETRTVVNRSTMGYHNAFEPHFLQAENATGKQIVMAVPPPAGRDGNEAI